MLLQKIKQANNRSSTFKFHEFEGSELESQNALIFGQNLFRLNHKNQKEDIRIFISQHDSSFIQILSDKMDYNKSKIYFYEINMIYVQSLQNKNIQNNPNNLIVNYGDYKELILDCKDEKQKMMIWQGIEIFININQQMARKSTSNFVQSIFEEFDDNNSNSLNFNEIQQGLHKMNIYIENEKLLQLLEKYDIDKNKEIDSQEFNNICIELQFRLELESIFSKYCPQYMNLNPKNIIEKMTTKVMSIEQLIEFFKQEQNEIKDDLQLERLIGTKDNKISLQMFIKLLFQDENRAVRMKSEEIQTIEGTLKLQDYIINSSHNTYLLGNQLTDAVNIHAYSNAIRLGCRCYEIDCWDGNNQYEIKVCHGFTVTQMTSSIHLDDVLILIKDNAFLYNSSPVILSLEIHCSNYNLYVIGQQLITILGPMLFIHNSFDSFPPISQMLNKVIVKAKRSFKDIDIFQYSQSRPDILNLVNPQIQVQPELISNNKKITEINLLVDKEKSDDNDDDDDYDNDEINDDNFNFDSDEMNEKQINPMKEQKLKKCKRETSSKQRNKKKVYLLDEEKKEEKDKVIEYRQMQRQSTKYIEKPLISYKNKEEMEDKEMIMQLQIVTGMFGGHFHMDDIESDKKSKLDISSLDENKIANYYKKHILQIQKYCSKFLIRTYPKGNRFDSSNYNPIQAIKTGSHLIALNNQTFDDNLLIYKSFFDCNGIHGYVYKTPQILNTIHQQNQIYIEIISGLNLSPFEINSTHQKFTLEVKVYLYEVNGKNSTFSYKTEHVKNNQFNPIFNAQNNKFLFKYLDPYVSFIIFKVKNITTKTEVLNGCVPISHLKQGYRVIQLQDTKYFEVENSSILIKITQN